jgi:mono/diheme cytochrome c family protein
MMKLFVALLLVPFLQVQSASAQTGDPSAGPGIFRGKLCRMCHGDMAEGGFGPTLAGGRGLTLDQFKRAIRVPWGVMPPYNENQMNEKQILDAYAWVNSLAPVPEPEPGDWHWRKAPETAALGQQLYISVGCGQCHEPENKFGRMWLGQHAKEVDYEYFAKQIYNHTDKYPRGAMGDYSKLRLPESVLREIYQWMVVDIGMRASVSAFMRVGEEAGGNTTYTLPVRNSGVKDVGLNTEGLTVFVRVPEGSKVVSAMGPGYVGVQPLKTLGLEPGLSLAPHAHDDTGHVERPTPDLSRDVMVWKVAKLDAGEKVDLSFTLTGAPTAAVADGFAGSTVHWESPGRNAKGSPPVMVYRDLRVPDKGDHEVIRFIAPRPAQ